MLTSARSTPHARRVRLAPSHHASLPALSRVRGVGVADSIRSDLWSMKQLIGYTGIIPPGLYLDRVLHVAQRELLQE